MEKILGGGDGGRGGRDVGGIECWQRVKVGAS